MRRLRSTLFDITYRVTLSQAHAYVIMYIMPITYCMFIMVMFTRAML